MTERLFHERVYGFRARRRELRLDAVNDLREHVRPVEDSLARGRVHHGAITQEGEP